MHERLDNLGISWTLCSKALKENRGECDGARKAVVVPGHFWGKLDSSIIITRPLFFYYYFPPDYQRWERSSQWSIAYAYLCEPCRPSFAHSPTAIVVSHPTVSPLRPLLSPSPPRPPIPPS